MRHGPAGNIFPVHENLAGSHMGQQVGTHIARIGWFTLQPVEQRQSFGVDRQDIAQPIQHIGRVGTHGRDQSFGTSAQVRSVIHRGICYLKGGTQQKEVLQRVPFQVQDARHGTQHGIARIGFAALLEPRVVVDADTRCGGDLFAT
ncbi:hypothetical protein GCM10027417_19590 [Glutamicibacter endophyticus]